MQTGSGWSYVRLHAFWLARERAGQRELEKELVNAAKAQQITNSRIILKICSQLKILSTETQAAEH
jgi:hypothetical protein